MSRVSEETPHSGVEHLEQSTASSKSDSNEMTGASKLLSADRNMSNSYVGSSSESIFTLLYSFAKKVTIVGAVYLVGYMGWSVAWLITPIVLSVSREYWHQTSELKRSIAKASATANEKDVILARISDLPAWVYFPDIERCEWINRILQQVWPNANSYAKDLVKDVIEPKIALALTEYKLSGFKFDRIQLGTIPPRIGGVKVYDKNTARNEIILDADLFYASDCDISFQLAGMKAGIKDFQIHGMIRVIMKPLISKIPLIGGLQIFFLNNPDIDFNLVGVADLLDMPGLSDMLRRIITEQIGAIMVLPNKLPISLSSEVPSIELKMPEPEGVLRIHVVEAKDLMKKDIGVLGKGKSDPYAVINVGAQQFRTQTIDSTVNPKWDYWCEAVIQAKIGQYVKINLFDKDETSDDEILGRATVEIDSVVRNGVLDTWIALEAAKHGMLHLRLTWMKLSTSSNDLQMALRETQTLRVTTLSSAILCVYLDSANDLPQARAQSKPDPYAVLSVGGKKSQQTGAIRRTDAPVWEQGFTFMISNPENDALQLKLIDQKTDKELGLFSYALNALLDKPNMTVVEQPFQLQRSGPLSKVNLSLALKVLIPPVNEARESISVGPNVAIQTPILAQVQPEAFAQPKVDLADFPQKEAEFNIDVRMPEISLSKMPSKDELPATELIHRKRLSSTASTTGQYNLGRIEITLFYITSRQRLSVTVNRITNIPLKDPSNIPDPYVKLYLLPGRAKETKRKTIVVKDSCNPVYEATFDYVISAGELNSTELEVTVSTQKGFFAGGSPVIGITKIHLDDPAIHDNGVTAWYDLMPEDKFE